MGNNASKGDEKNQTRLTAEEKQALQAVFHNACGQASSCNRNCLKKQWDGVIEEELLENILKYLFPGNEPRNLNFEGFAKLFVCMTRGGVEEKASTLMGIASHAGDQISSEALIEYIKMVTSSYIRIVTEKKQLKGYVCQESLKHFCHSLAHDIIFKGQSPKDTWTESEKSCTFNQDDVEKWLMCSPVLVTMQTCVFRHLYKMPVQDEDNLFPMCRDVDSKFFPSMLDLTSVLFLNSALPKEMKDQWRLLFSTKVHGESFSKFLNQISDKGATVLVVKDKDDHVFGGFAPVNWYLGPKFIGDQSSFLFSLTPKMGIYSSTGYNEHYMYLNIQQQTLPNGLGMGGQFGYFGLWLDADFGEGHCSETCTTFHCPMLSGSKQFNISHLEVWGVGPPPLTAHEKGERSILDADPEAQAILEMIGKGRHSEGLREPEENEEL